MFKSPPFVLLFACVGSGITTMQTRWWWLIRTSDITGDKRLIMSWEEVDGEDSEETYWLALLPKTSILGTSEGGWEGWEISQSPPSLMDWLLWGPRGEQMVRACPQTQSNTYTLIQHCHFHKFLPLQNILQMNEMIYTRPPRRPCVQKILQL